MKKATKLIFMLLIFMASFLLFGSYTHNLLIIFGSLIITIFLLFLMPIILKRFIKENQEDIEKSIIFDQRLKEWLESNILIIIRVEFFIFLFCFIVTISGTIFINIDPNLKSLIFNIGVTTLLFIPFLFLLSTQKLFENFSDLFIDGPVLAENVLADISIYDKFMDYYNSIIKQSRYLVITYFLIPNIMLDLMFILIFILRYFNIH